MNESKTYRVTCGQSVLNYFRSLAAASSYAREVTGLTETLVVEKYNATLGEYLPC